MDVVANSVGGGDGPQVRPKTSSGEDLRGRLQFGSPVLHRTIAQPTPLATVMLSGGAGGRRECIMLCLPKQRDVVCVGIPGSRSRKFPASMAFPSPVSKGHVGANTPGRRKTSCRRGELSIPGFITHHLMPCSKHSGFAARRSTASLSRPFRSPAARDAASSPPSMIHHVDQLDGLPDAPNDACGPRSRYNSSPFDRLDIDTYSEVISVPYGRRHKHRTAWLPSSTRRWRRRRR